MRYKKKGVTSDIASAGRPTEVVGLVLSCSRSPESERQSSCDVEEVLRALLMMNHLLFVNEDTRFVW